MPRSPATRTRPSGIRALAFVSAEISPVSASSRILAWIVVPMSGSSTARPARAMAATDSPAARIRAAARR